MKEEVKQRMMQQIEMALLKLNHVPFIVSKKQKMAVWSDIREILFMKCVGQKCSVVLSALKSHLRYPASEKFMHPCSPSEQLQFMKKYVVVSPGTLLVDLNCIGDRFELMKLFDMVKIKHDMSGDDTIRRCRELSEKRRSDRNIQLLLESPLRNLTKKIFLPSIERKSNKVHNTEREGRLIKSVLYNSYGEEASAALIPMYLLKETYPASVCVLEEAVRLYIIGQSAHANLASVSQCTREEGYHFSRFMAMQFGFEKQWPCFTSSSLLISWEEFWLTNGRNNDVNLVPNINVSVVTLICQTKERPEQKLGLISSKASSKVQNNPTARNGQEEKTSENLQYKIKESETNSLITNQTTCKRNTQAFQRDYEKDKNLENKPILLEHEGLRTRLPQPVSVSLKKSKSYTSSTSKQSRNNVNSPRKSNSNNILPGINTSKFLSTMKDNQEDNIGAQDVVQGKTQTDKRVTRSKSHSAVSINNNLISIKNKDWAINGSIFRPKGSNCSRKIVGTGPDENNSAVHGVGHNKKTPENTSGNLSQKSNKKNDSLQISTISQESISNGQLVFDVGSIEVSITPKKKQETVGKSDVEENALAMHDQSGKKSPLKRFTDRKNLRIPSAKFSDKIPDLLRVGKKLGNSDRISLNDKQMASPKVVNSQNKRTGSLKETVGHNFEKRINSPDCLEQQEGKVITKSLELNIISQNPNSKGRELYTHKGKIVKHAKKKESNIDDNSYPIINGIKLHNSPIKIKDRPACKSAGTLPGPLNTLPNKAKSASHERTGKLPNEIVSSLKKQATNSICSVLGNSDENTLKGIIASGKEIISPRKSITRSGADHSDFQTERISMWRDRVEENSSSPKSGRICKSADVFNRKERLYAYRPSSSIYYPSYSDQKGGNGPSIKTGLCVLMSRDRNKSPKVTSIRNTYQMPKKDSSPKKDKESKSVTIDEVDIPNYGSSSSKTPDIYDEFARKKKPRGSKQDVQMVKGKQMSCEQKYGQSFSFSKTKNYESKIKKPENGHKNDSTKRTHINQRMDSQNAPRMIDSAYNGVAFQQYQNRANNETRNLPLSTNMYRILDVNLTKYSKEQIGNACNSNQYTTCSMCWHESNMVDGAEIGQSFSNFNSTDLNSKTSIGDLQVVESEVIKTIKNSDEVNRNDTDPYHKICASKESLLERIKSIEDNTQGRKLILSSSEEEQVPLDIDDPDANTHIKLLDKMNIFVDGISAPQQSDSLDNIENIKNIIKINPIKSQNQLSDGLINKERLCKSLCDFVQSGFTKPELLNSNVAKTEEDISFSLSTDTCDDQLMITENQLEACSLEVSEDILKPDSYVQHDRIVENDYCDKKHENDSCNVYFDQVNDNSIELDTITGLEIKDMIDSYSIDHHNHAKKTMSKEIGNDASSFSDHNKDKSSNKIAKTRNSKRKGKSKTARNRSKSFKEVVEEKRASKRKADLELAKKKFWKSANPSVYNEPKNGVSNKTQKKKTIIKTLSEDNAGIEVAPKLSVKTEKKKRPQTCPVYSVKTCEKDYFNKAASKNDIAKEKQKNTKANDYKETDESDEDFKFGKNFGNCRTSNKNLGKSELYISIERAEENCHSERILRSQAIRSAKSSKSIKKKKRNSFIHSTDEDEVLHLENEDNIKTGETYGSKKFQARQKKLRLKVHNECSPKGVKTCKQKVDNSNIPSSKSGLEQVDESKIICETVQFENILEVADNQSEDIACSQTRTFITQSNEHPFQQEINSLKLENSLPFEEMPPLDQLSSLETYAESNIKDAFENCYADMIPESASSKQHMKYLSLENGSLISKENMSFDESRVSWNYLHDTTGIKNIDLSELPESVLEVVLSDNLINMTSYLSPDQVTGEEKDLSAIEREENTLRIFKDKESATGEAELEVPVNTANGGLLHGTFYPDKVTGNNREACYLSEEPVYQFNNLDLFDQQLNDEHVDCSLSQGAIDDLSQNAITVLHPNGRKLYLTTNHPAYEIFSNVFVQKNCNGSVVDINNLIVQPNQTLDNLQGTAMTFEDEKLVESSAIRQEIGEVTIDNNEKGGNNCGKNYERGSVEDVSKQENECTHKRLNKDRITKETVSKYFDKLSMSKHEQTAKKSKDHSHSDNIFDLLKLELDKMTRKTVPNLSPNLLPEMKIEERIIDATETHEDDFERDIIEMMGESLENKLSGREDNLNSAPFYDHSNNEEMQNSNVLHQIERSSSYSNKNPINVCNDSLSPVVNLCYGIDKCSEGTNQTYGIDVSKDNSDFYNDDIEELIQPEAQPSQDMIRSVALGLRKNKLDKQRGMSSEVDVQSDTSNCESPETCKYGDDSCSDLSCSDFVPDGDETSDDNYESNSDESEFDGGSFCNNEHKQTVSKVGTLLRGKKRLKRGNRKKYHLKEKSYPTKALEKKEKVNYKGRRNRRLRRKTSSFMSNDEENAKGKDGHEDTVSVNSLVTTQRLYLDILKNSMGNKDYETAETVCRYTENLEDILSEGFTLKRDRDLTRIEAEVERLKEGTGSLADLEKEDCGDTIVNDPTTNCRYQVVEDEDGITLGGVVYYNEYVLPFVYINGYKYTPLKDAATLFQPDCCAWKCRIPKNVMTKDKRLFKTFSTWEQVYKLELIKMKKGPPIKTGDVLVKFDSFVTLLPSLLLEIIAQHKNSKLKYSQDCDMKSYLALQGKIK